jgi:hypothetical protein
MLGAEKTGFFKSPLSYSFLDIFKNVQNPKPKKTFGKYSYRNTEKMIYIIMVTILKNIETKCYHTFLHMHLDAHFELWTFI